MAGRTKGTQTTPPKKRLSPPKPSKKISAPPAAQAHQKAITEGLRSFFKAVTNEPVPEEMLDLLRKMDEGKKERG